MSMLGAFEAAFRGAFFANAGRMSSMIRSGNAAAPDFNQLYVKSINDTKSGIEFKDLANLQKVLRDLDPTLFSKFKKDATKLGNPARDAVRKEFRRFKVGPRGAPSRPGRIFDKMATNGRLSWAESRSKRNVVDVNYKANITNKKLSSKYATAGDKTLSLIRVRVRGGSYVLADMAGKSNTARKATGQMSRQYRINLFGRGVVTRSHRVNADNVTNWINRLNETSDARKASRYAWPAIEGHALEYRKNFSGILNEYIAETNRKLQA